MPNTFYRHLHWGCINEMETAYQTSYEYSTVIQDDHLIILCENEFRHLQISEIRRFQDRIGKRDNSTASLWIQDYAPSFREAWSRFVFRSWDIKTIVQTEMQRHRWIESEKAGRDLGVDAEIDWLMRYGYLFQRNR